MQVGAGPVQHRHEVIGHAENPAGGQVAQRLLVILDVAQVLARSGFDMLVHRNAFHHTPDEARFGNQRLAGPDLFHGPHFAVGDMVQGVDNVGHAGLADKVEGYRVLRAVPAPAFAHRDHMEKVLKPPSTTVMVPVTAREASEAR